MAVLSRAALLHRPVMGLCNRAVPDPGVDPHPAKARPNGLGHHWDRQRKNFFWPALGQAEGRAMRRPPRVQTVPGLGSGPVNLQKEN